MLDNQIEERLNAFLNPSRIPWRPGNRDADACASLWQAGIVAGWYLRPSQWDVYELLSRERYTFIEAARRFGKTTSILTFVFEKLIKNPGWICRWCFPNKNQAREVLVAEIAKVQRTIHKSLRFEYQTTDSVYIHPNGSKLYLRGVNEDRGDSARGPAANIIICDEYGFWIEPDYIVKECLLPQLENQDGRWLIKASTPPRDLGHLYYTERENAEREGRLIQKIILDNEALSPEEMAEIIKECGGIESPSFRRERLCEPVSDPEMLVIPEFSDSLTGNVVPDDYPRPDFFTPYVGGDSGADDNTAILFGYYDFIRDEDVIEEEYITKGKTTKEIIAEAKKIEARLWPDITPHRRVYDAPKQLIYDIFVTHKWPVSMPEKSDKHAAIHSLRVRVGSRKFKVKEKCKGLRRQLKVGLWRDDKHTDFVRSDALGHLDAVIAAVYFNRSIDRKHNPIPPHFGISFETHYIPPDSSSSLGTVEDQIASIFGRS